MSKRFASGINKNKMPMPDKHTHIPKTEMATIDHRDDGDNLLTGSSSLEWSVTKLVWASIIGGWSLAWAAFICLVVLYDETKLLTIPTMMVAMTPPIVIQFSLFIRQKFQNKSRKEKHNGGYDAGGNRRHTSQSLTRKPNKKVAVSASRPSTCSTARNKESKPTLLERELFMTALPLSRTPFRIILSQPYLG